MPNPLNHAQLQLTELERNRLYSKATSLRQCEVCKKLVEVKDVSKPAKTYCTLSCQQSVPQRNRASGRTVRQGPFAGPTNNWGAKK